MKGRSWGPPRCCLAAEFPLGEVLVKGVSLAVGSGFGSSEFTISPYIWAREAQNAAC